MGQSRASRIRRASDSRGGGARGISCLRRRDDFHVLRKPSFCQVFAKQDLLQVRDLIYYGGGSHPRCRLRARIGWQYLQVTRVSPDWNALRD
jgi:hypothetical protein